MYAYHWSDDNVIVPTPARLIHRYAFQRASKEAATIMADANLTAQWQQRFEAQTKNKHFRPYIVGVLLAEYKQQLRAEYEAHQTLNGQQIDTFPTKTIM